MQRVLLINLLILSGIVYASEKPEIVPEAHATAQTLQPSDQVIQILAWWEKNEPPKPTVRKIVVPSDAISAAQRNQNLRKESNGTRGTKPNRMDTPYTKVWRERYPEAKN